MPDNNRILVGNGRHTLVQPVAGGEWSCSRCTKTWKQKPRPATVSVCPGVPIYEWGNAPVHLKRPNELKKMGLVEAGTPKGVLITQEHLYYLWDVNEAEPRPQKKMSVDDAR